MFCLFNQRYLKTVEGQPNFPPITKPYEIHNDLKEWFQFQKTRHELHKNDITSDIKSVPSLGYSTPERNDKDFLDLQCNNGVFESPWAGRLFRVTWEVEKRGPGVGI